ncbi:MAG: Thiamine biosynthesis lipoprotein ApbE precursor [candidate division WS6 bacterium OLB20]|uniref:FAD:protein FMN transferase n=1 Tax=candidate division WS6 bacterium OLB20 TaxID=1617426 RepID=A0A136LW35_9BACT|nr:MAG: Thiamine biosynthesis lipoprotein ApbE precursor [candidate division WS6 bacterium OLB20]
MPAATEFTDERVFMNTRIQITLISDRGTVAARTAINDAYTQFDNVVKRFTRFEPSSELSRLNASSGQIFPVSEDLFSLIETMLSVAEKTDGAFDPTIIDLLEMYGFSKEQDYTRMNDPDFLGNIRSYVKDRPSFREIELDRDAMTVRLVRGQRLDLGSIGKGYAIDLAAEKLSGHTGFKINAGGDLRAGGTHADGSPWKLGVVKLGLPNKAISDPELLGYIETEAAALAGSGGWVRRVAWFHHLLNPKSGLPDNTSSQSYVTAASATAADLWSTALFVTGSDGIRLLEKENDIEGMLISSDGSVHSSRGFSLLT